MKGIVIVLVALALAGCCGGSTPEAEPAPQLLTAQKVAITDGGLVSTTFVYRFADPSNGVTCYLMTRSEAVAISCLPGVAP